MKPTNLLMLVSSLILVATLIVAGCVGDNSNNAQQSSGNQPATTTTNDVGSGGQNANPSGDHTGVSSQTHSRGAGFLSNATLISAAAVKLGVNEDALRTALNSTAGGRMNLTSAAQQLGVTPAQLTDALGIPAGGFRGRTGNNATAPATMSTQ